VIDQLRVNPIAATTGLDDIGDDIRSGARRAGEEIKEGAEKTGEAVKEGAKKTGEAVKDVFTDDDKDSDKDGK